MISGLKIFPSKLLGLFRVLHVIKRHYYTFNVIMLNVNTVIFDIFWTEHYLKYFSFFILFGYPSPYRMLDRFVPWPSPFPYSTFHFLYKRLCDIILSMVKNLDY